MRLRIGWGSSALGGSFQGWSASQAIHWAVCLPCFKHDHLEAGGSARRDAGRRAAALQVGSAPTQKSVLSLCWLLAISKADADHCSVLPSDERKASPKASMAAGGLWSRRWHAYAPV